MVEGDDVDGGEVATLAYVLGGDLVGEVAAVDGSSLVWMECSEKLRS